MIGLYNVNVYVIPLAGGCVTQNYESWTPGKTEPVPGKTKFKSKFAESLQNIYTFSSRPLRGSREACEDEEEIGEKKDVGGSGSLGGSDRDVRERERESDGEKLDRLADSNCEVKIIRSSVITKLYHVSHLTSTIIPTSYLTSHLTPHALPHLTQT